MLVVDRGESGMLSAGVGASDYAVSGLEEEDDIDWMSMLLSSPLFEFIPPANIQTLFSKFEEIKFDADKVVIRQNETGDYFYVIQSGKVKVVRSAGTKTMLLAELKAGDCFGQDALVSNVPRNATITMKTPGVLMRLSAPDFESLLMEPVVETVTMDEAREMIEKGEPRTYILDVRNPKEAEADKILGALNVPVLLLRKNLPKLKPEAIYITACDGGKRAKLAAYILNEKGFTAYVLR
jgi:rhodanese-related sulfurtransferase